MEENATTIENTNEPSMEYTKELRAATKDVHKLSDVLVNAKFAFALTDDSVWADGLLSFYEIYKYLEDNLPEDLLPKDLHRTESFEKDFRHFWGSDWKKTYEIRPAVQRYLDHLEEVNKKSKILLFAYAYQMYMALMSGGQLLQKKRMIARKLWPEKLNDNTNEDIGNGTPLDSVNNESDDLTARPMPAQVEICPDGCAATFFPKKIPELKAKLRTILNHHYGSFDKNTKTEFLEESRRVFHYNSDVVRSIKGVNAANLRKLAIAVLFFVGIYFAIKMAKR